MSSSLVRVQFDDVERELVQYLSASRTTVGRQLNPAPGAKERMAQPSLPPGWFSFRDPHSVNEDLGQTTQ
jgi:hypothetical protein